MTVRQVKDSVFGELWLGEPVVKADSAETYLPQFLHLEMVLVEQMMVL